MTDDTNINTNDDNDNDKNMDNNNSNNNKETERSQPEWRGCSHHHGDGEIKHVPGVPPEVPEVVKPLQHDLHQEHHQDAPVHHVQTQSVDTQPETGALVARDIWSNGILLIVLVHQNASWEFLLTILI